MSLEEHQKDHESNEQYDLGALEESLLQLKGNLEQEQTQEYTGKDHETRRKTNQELAGLAEKMVNLLRNKTEVAEHLLAEKSELMTFANTIISQVNKKQDLYAEHFSVDEERKLLLELMYGVLASLGRKQAVEEVMVFSQEARGFFDHLGIGKRYELLLEKST